MNEPKTLLQIAGVTSAPGKFSESAVVVIDAQNEYVTGKFPLAGVAAALDQLAALDDENRERVAHAGPPQEGARSRERGNED
jgi:hypothetical protein